ncbi:hypothetical protein [Agrobacterium tumefaciens]|uniref:hypothetical protein n=1 Tax=Agrobacterium tumefaciens TaxID=358 RepID=UPI0021D27538|nr:hypothetical protein [Agrobacterium tumefaciens]UXS24180.1 hypothetical protein FY153_06800 [Agrobacterium tumefaciens]UXS52346.1 hypothetical protein FY148_06605 [Agrobacterium tumefaciens]UXS62592.1 hypothetical protein FY147_06605 [Agrobacterium tumefaciens]
MPYVERKNGVITGVYAVPQEGYAEEWVDEADLLPSIADYENAIQNLVDNTARERQFRDGVTLASYIGSTKSKWAAEANAFVAWRDNVWTYAYGELAKVQAGQRQQPTVEQFLGEIARIAWPVA